MGLFNWGDRQAAHEKAIMEHHFASWTEAIRINRDLVCRNCYGCGPWTFSYLPMLVVTRMTTNPMVVICPCGACLTFEEGLIMRDLHRELEACVPAEGA